MNGYEPINAVGRVLLEKQDFLAMGLTKREYFAAIAMQGLLANTAIILAVSQDPKDPSSDSDIAAMAVEHSDHLITELNKTKKV